MYSHTKACCSPYIYIIHISQFCKYRTTFCCCWGICCSCLLAITAGISFMYNSKKKTSILNFPVTFKNLTTPLFKNKIKYGFMCTNLTRPCVDVRNGFWQVRTESHVITLTSYSVLIFSSSYYSFSFFFSPQLNLSHKLLPAIIRPLCAN